MALQKLKGEVDKEQIEAWKKKYGQVFKVEVENSCCYLRKPGRKELSYASTIGLNSSGAIDSVKFGEAIITSCWLGGDEIIKEDDDLFLSVLPTIEELVKRSEAKIKKL